MLRGIFSQRKGKNKGKTPGIMVVKLLLLIKFLRFQGKRKKKMRGVFWNMRGFGSDI